MKSQKNDLHITDEVSELTNTVLGIAVSPGQPRGINAKAAEAIQKGFYPSEAELILAMKGFENVLSEQGVTVLKPNNIDDLNQIFVRDLGFVVDDIFIVASMKETVRSPELDGLSQVLEFFHPDKIIRPPEGVYIEGGDIVLAKDTIFAGIGRRTNEAAVGFLRTIFSNKRIIPLETQYASSDPRVSILHLDCAFQPVGSQYAILYEKGFVSPPKVIFDLFGTENIITVSSEEMYQMVPNIFSISPSKVVSCASFVRLNKLLKERGIDVISIDYENVSILGGLLRCSTLPLSRKN
jgi:N-dimethylarginine dimethylaminohydrolase